MTSAIIVVLYLAIGVLRMAICSRIAGYKNSIQCIIGEIEKEWCNKHPIDSQWVWVCIDVKWYQVLFNMLLNYIIWPVWFAQLLIYVIKNAGE